MQEEVNNIRAYKAAETIDRLDIILRTMDTKKDKTRIVITKLFKQLCKELEFVLLDSDTIINLDELPRSPLYKKEYKFVDHEKGIVYDNIKELREKGEGNYTELINSTKPKSSCGRWERIKVPFNWHDVQINE